MALPEWALAICLVLGLLTGPPATPAWADEGAIQRDLLAGVRAFRAERYDEAMALFQRVQATGKVGEIGLYLGMTQHKLGRHMEALISFRAAHRAGAGEPVASYYEAVSCYRLGLLARARSGFLILTDLRPFDSGPDTPPPVGPRLRGGAQRFVQAIDEATAQVPPLSRYRAVLASAQALLPGSPAEAREWLDEAEHLLPLLPDPGKERPRLLELVQQAEGRPPSGAGPR